MAAPAGGLVVVDGPGALAVEVAHQVRRAGLVVRAGPLAADAELVAGDAGCPALVVLVRDRAVPLWAGVVWHARGVPHLPVEATASTTVGPLVLPGRSACLACLARRRPPPGARPERVPPEDPAARVLAAAVVTVTALAVLRGDDRLAGISTEIGPRAETVTHRVWHAGPECRCSSGRMAG
jgi:hypothetical protein